MILDEILAHKRREIAEVKKLTSLADLQKKALSRRTDSFAKAIKAEDGVNLIAEIKKASPSKGVLLADFDPAKLARTYAENGAAALSVLTDSRFFQGDSAHLRVAKQVSRLPALRKEFIIDEYQLWETLAMGADAVLLIVAALEKSQLQNFLRISAEFGLDALVEVHDAAQLDAALQAEARIIGINNRDLRTFHTDLRTTLELAPKIPEDVILVSESGIKTASDVNRLKEARVDAILVGEALVTSADIPAKMRELLGGQS